MQSRIPRDRRARPPRRVRAEAEVVAIHAGLGVRHHRQEDPGMDMVSLGPTIRGAHSPEERVDVGTVERYWNYLLTILRHVD